MFMMVMERYEVSWVDEKGEHSLTVWGEEKLVDLLSIVAGTSNSFSRIEVEHVSRLGDYVQTTDDHTLDLGD